MKMLPDEFQCSNCLDCGHVKTIQVTTAKVTRLGLPEVICLALRYRLEKKEVRD